MKVEGFVRKGDTEQQREWRQIFREAWRGERQKGKQL